MTCRAPAAQESTELAANRRPGRLRHRENPRTAGQGFTWMQLGPRDTPETQDQTPRKPERGNGSSHMVPSQSRPPRADLPEGAFDGEPGMRPLQPRPPVRRCASLCPVAGAAEAACVMEQRADDSRGGLRAQPSASPCLSHSFERTFFLPAAGSLAPL